LGRKSFDFSKSDIQQLQDIAILRKFGFSIAEIKEMLSAPSQIIPIAKELQQRKQNTINEENSLLQALLRLDENQSYTITELAAQLSAPVVNEPLPSEDYTINIGKVILYFFKSLLLGVVTWLPLVLSLLAAIISIHSDAYPVFNPKAFVVVLFALSPTLLMVLLPKDKVRFPWLPISRKVLIVLCILSIPISFISSISISSRSETSDIRNYRRFDTDCLANRCSFFQDLFPIWPHYLDAHYYYRNLPAMDYTYDIYAEWPLEKEEFDKEVARVQALYESQSSDYVTVQKGDYTCFFLYDGNPPFEEVTDSYTYFIFAFDEQNLIVRYIMCDSLENGVDQPYYLSLDW
jgi:DNA-binding transcriptional MerR regulator